ncbi:MAG TPA: hypothetical protein VIK93_11205 [Limnochordales bacterium]
MKVAVRGNARLLGNTPEEIIAGLWELGFLVPEGASAQDYLHHLERVLAERHGVRIPADIAPAERAERVVLALVETGQLDLLED